MSHVPESPVDAWTPSPQACSTYTTSVAKVPCTSALQQGSLVGPFKERLLHSAEPSHPSDCQPGKKAPQSSICHSGIDRQQATMPKNVANLSQPPRSDVNGLAGRLQGQARSCSSQSHCLSQKQAITRVAAAQAALRDATHALQPVQAQQQPAVYTANIQHPSSLPEQQQHSHKASKSIQKRASSQPIAAAAPAPSGSQLLEGLWVQGVKQHKQQQQQQQLSLAGGSHGGLGCVQEPDDTAQHVALAAKTGPVSKEERGSERQSRRQCQPQLYTQLLRYSYAIANNVEQTPAAAVAAQALIKRLRLQQRSRQGPQPFQRGSAPRPTSPPPVQLTGALLLDSCPGACCPDEVTTADLTSSDITTIPMPLTVPCTDLQEPVAVQGAAEGATGLSTAVATATVAESELLRFTQLGVLDLSDNRLSCIAGLAWLPALWQLSVSANRLRSLQSLAQVLGLAQTAASVPHHFASEDSGKTGSRGSTACSATNPTVINDDGGSSEASLLDSDSIESCTDLSNAARVDSDHPPQPDADESASEEQLQTVAQEEYMRMPVCEPSVAALGESTSAVAPVTSKQPSADTLPAAPEEQPTVAVRSEGFSNLQVLDVSYNMLPADHLLGQHSPLARLPRLQMLVAAGNGLQILPLQLGVFSSLTHLDLGSNTLTDSALISLSKLPALVHLVLANNPIRAAPDVLAEHCADSTAVLVRQGRGDPTTAAACGSFETLSWLDLSYSRVEASEQLLPLLLLPKLRMVQVTGTPLSERCTTSTEAVQVLEDAGLRIITHQHEVKKVWQHNAKHKSQQHRCPYQRQRPGDNSSHPCLQFMAVDESLPASGILAAASKHAIIGLQHEQLMAAFERVGEGINNWQLAPVLEEDSTTWDPQSEATQACCHQGTVEQASNVEDDEPIVDNTFLTGVGITGALPYGEGDQKQLSGLDAFQDPTERLALALGLHVRQLAHYSHVQPGNPSGAIHRLRHALAHPLVDPEAGQRPDQHHTSMTVAAIAKQRPQQLLPLPQPISTTMDTQIVAIQGIDSLLHDMKGRLQALEGSLLQQLQDQANKLSAVSQQMTQSAETE